MITGSRCKIMDNPMSLQTNPDLFSIFHRTLTFPPLGVNNSGQGNTSKVPSLFLRSKSALPPLGD